jgi:glycosyltransferase involved in cell wall biosynthesis
MKIAVFHDLLSGGAKRALHESVRRLAANHHIDVFTLSSANHSFCDLRPQVDHYHIFDFQPLPLARSPFGRLNQAIRLTDLMRLRRVARAVARSIEGGGYDVVFVEPCQYETAPSLLRSLRGPPMVYYCQEPLRLLYEPTPSRPYDRPDSKRQHTLDRLDPLIPLYFKTLKDNDQRNIRRADRVLVNSAFVQDAVRRIYHVEAQVSYLGVDAQLFRPVAIEKRRMVLSVGSLTPMKGFDFLIQAVSRIPRPARPELAIASNFQNARERAYLEELARGLDVDLRLPGNVSDAQLVDLYNQALVTVYAPHREPFGLVPVESLACQTPVVAVREGGIQETIVHEHTGLLIERDPELFARAVAGLLDQPELAAAYGRNGRERVLRYWTWDQAVATLESHLISIAKKGQAPAA